MCLAAAVPVPVPVPVMVLALLWERALARRVASRC